MISPRDAKKKICPMMKSLCLGDECMLWRWATVEQLATSVQERIRLDDGVGSDPAKFIAEGFCGLVGVPGAAS